jgi:uncharacterized protein YjiS (DUF1127 family)
MSCTYKTCSAPSILQPVVPVRTNRPALAKPFVTITEVLQDALAVVSTCCRIAQRRRARRELRMLDSRMLADIGLTREAADNEARKWFWQ